MKIRKPRIRIGKRGPRLTNVGVRLGGKRAGVNLSRRGASGSIKVGKASYNTKRGCSLPFFGILFFLLLFFYFSTGRKVGR